MSRFIFIILVITVIIYKADYSFEQSHSLDVANIISNADQFKKTVVTAHLEQSITKGKNVLWCATAQIGWNKLCAFFGEDIHLTPRCKMAEILNKKTVTCDDLDDDMYIALAGIFNEHTVDEIKTQLQQKFKGTTSPEILKLLESLPPHGFFTYSYLFAYLPFERSFTRHSWGLTFDNTAVECFGIDQYMPEDKTEAKLAEQVFIYDYYDPNDFIIELKTQKPDHHLILAKVNPKKTLAKTIKLVRNRINKAPPICLKDVAEYIDVVIPVIDLNIMRNYSELVGKRIKRNNKQYDGWPFVLAKQLVRFKLDEKGAILKSESATYVLCMGFGNIVFDKPFLILLFYKNSENPYFALWIDNAELMVGSEKHCKY